MKISHEQIIGAIRETMYRDDSNMPEKRARILGMVEAFQAIVGDDRWKISELKTFYEPID